MAYLPHAHHPMKVQSPVVYLPLMPLLFLNQNHCRYYSQVCKRHLKPHINIYTFKVLTQTQHNSSRKPLNINHLPPYQDWPASESHWRLRRGSPSLCHSPPNCITRNADKRNFPHYSSFSLSLYFLCISLRFNMSIFNFLIPTIDLSF